MELAHIDYLETGEGPPVILVHSSVSGARQWRKLMTSLAPAFNVKAINLYGYGTTPAWASEDLQTLDDQAVLVEALVSNETDQLNLVGHSFGGAVVMKAALRLGDRVGKVVLLEPNPFFLLREHGRSDAFAEASALRDVIKSRGAQKDWMAAAEQFADYWGGRGSWARTDPNRRSTFAEALKPNLHEWDAVMNEQATLIDFAEKLPRSTLVVHDPKTVRPIKEIVELLQVATAWTFESIPEGGHMAPLSHPDIVNPIVERFLKG